MKLPLTLLAAAFFCAPSAFSQGPLTPPSGTPAPVMKSLDQLEPRTPIPAAGPFPYTISQSGSYYLTGNITGNTDALVVDAADVAIDLNGFTITGTSGTPRAVSTTANARRLSVKNGTILQGGAGIDAVSVVGVEMLDVTGVKVTDCTGPAIRGGSNCRISGCSIRGGSGTTHGINVGLSASIRDTGVVLTTGIGILTNNGSSLTGCVVSGGNSGIVTGDHAILSDCRVSGTGTYGITAGAGAVIERCVVSGITAGGSSQAAIQAGSSSRITDSVARLNVVNTGISVGSYSSLEGCVSSSNTSASNLSYGFDMASYSSAIGCTATDMRSTYSTPGEFTGAGFRIDNGGLIRECISFQNRGAGIIAAGAYGATIAGNTCAANLTGIFLSNGGKGNRIEGNHVVENKTGIRTVSTSIGNHIVRNTAGLNTVNNWDISAGNFVAPVVVATASAAVTGNSGGAALGSTDPNANFTLP